MMTFLYLLAGLVFLIAGAEVLIRGASRLAATFGVPPLVIGLTVVAFGTSAPEVAVSVQSSLDGQAGLAVGNVVGSNIFNILFILGLSALIVPLSVSRQLVRFDVPLMVAISFLVLLLGYNGNLSRLEGALLFSGLIAYTVFLIIQGRKEKQQAQDEFVQEYGADPASTAKHWPIDLLLVIGGLVLLVLGSRWLVQSAITIAQHFGVSDLIIGLTIVAAGTSLPEVVTSVVASIKGERDIAVGNVVGSNIFNLLGVLGLSSMVSAGGLEVSRAALGFDIPVMIAAAFACLPIFFTGYLIARWEGALFLGYYIAYTLYLILATAQHDSLGAFRTAMVYFVMPLTVVTLLVVTVRAGRGQKGR